jgi:hypothetical protein
MTSHNLVYLFRSIKNQIETKRNHIKLHIQNGHRNVVHGFG